ncbi:zinc-dependent metalloprotease [Nonlabens ponticola]|uniref:DUF5117 domain-containing protein n=1 Tax=Nonlabens ponticola TaxID=2496866 RepID=A0A3S9MYD8_9FLAO|nr:zinc-dependent metalloprotease [Nonlabens ponticola]AZQ44200.1 DUF5117 domain-containing protein [Nonlabens ponticola]
MRILVIIAIILAGSTLTSCKARKNVDDLAFAKAQSTKTPQQFKGFFNFNYDVNKGAISLEVKDLDSEFLYVHALATGLGSNDIGLDRGQLGGGVVVKWIKAGNKLLLVQPNLSYRAITENNEEQASVEEAFARSVLYGFEIKKTVDDVHTIDLTPFLLEDAHGVAQRLKSRNQGIYKIDKSRSALWMENTMAFPDNVEFQAMLTFTGEPKGSDLRSVAPDASSVSVIQHHSFVRLPDDQYEPREFHPRSGSFYTSYLDYSTPISQPIRKRLITRHRLAKKNPELAMSEPVEPIIYYLDPGTPQPVRDALIDGASWWNEAFEAAGYKNAFQVKMLPADAHPLDVRYNVIQWVHRSTRGWSYGGSITDPRTGEIIKGHVSLGSLRIRQDYMLAQGMLDKPFANGQESPEMLEMALARIRQLGAHEVGHTLGFAHNFAASMSDRASVMDYPHPKYDLKNGKIDLSDAYDTGIGEWDKLTVQYSYGDPAAGQSQEEYLQSILQKAIDQDLLFITDSDARASSGASADAHLWDSGESAVDELERILKVRQVAMKQFGLDNIPNGQPISVLEDVFVPVYFSHRYQVEAASKLLGGMRYSYAIKGDPKFTYVQKAEHEKALKVLLNTLDVNQLTIPEDLLTLFAPRSYGYNRDRESFKSQTGVAFDPVAAAVTSADITLDLMLNATRLNRIAQQEIYGDNLELSEMIEELTDKIFSNDTNTAYEQLITDRIKEQYVNKLLMATNSSSINAVVKGQILAQISRIESLLSKSSNPTDKVLLQSIEQARQHPEMIKELPVAKIPDGSPIGSCGM